MKKLTLPIILGLSLLGANAYAINEIKTNQSNSYHPQRYEDNMLAPTEVALNETNSKRDRNSSGRTNYNSTDRYEDKNLQFVNAKAEGFEAVVIKFI